MIAMKIKIVVLLMLVVNVSNAQEVDEKKESGFFDMPVENLMGVIDFDLE